jgi:hypothetical protein
MKAIKLYSGFISEAVIEGKESIPAVEIGDDEFIELDEHGKPTKNTKAQKELAKKVTTKKKKITSINKKLADEDIQLSKDNKIADTDDNDSNNEPIISNEALKEDEPKKDSPKTEESQLAKKKATKKKVTKKKVAKKKVTKKKVTKKKVAKKKVTKKK